MKNLYNVVSLILLFVLLLGCKANYTKKMSKAIRSAVGSDLKGYQTFSYPTDNYGLITSYNSSVGPENFICDMWNCINVATVPTDTKDWLKLNGFAAVGAGGSLTLSESVKKKYAVNVLLPKIYDVVKVGAGVNFSEASNVTLTIGRAYIRQLRKDPIEAYISSLNNTSSIKKAYNAGTLAYIVADCVIEDLAVSVKVDNNLASQLDVAIGSELTSKVFSDASLSIKVDKEVNGMYTFKVSHPVIYARLAKKQPTAGELSENEFFSDWLPLVLSDDPSSISKR